MTRKEANKLRHDLFVAGLENEDIAKALEVYDVAYLYQVSDCHRQSYIVLTKTTQLNSWTIENNGFDPKTATARRIMTFNRKTKAVTF